MADGPNTERKYDYDGQATTLTTTSYIYTLTISSSKPHFFRSFFFSTNSLTLSSPALPLKQIRCRIRHQPADSAMSPEMLKIISSITPHQTPDQHVHRLPYHPEEEEPRIWQTDPCVLPYHWDPQGCRHNGTRGHDAQPVSQSPALTPCVQWLRSGLFDLTGCLGVPLRCVLRGPI